jgi:hypothetical protein
VFVVRARIDVPSPGVEVAAPGYDARDCGEALASPVAGESHALFVTTCRLQSWARMVHSAQMTKMSKARITIDQNG